MLTRRPRLSESQLTPRYRRKRLYCTVVHPWVACAHRFRINNGVHAERMIKFPFDSYLNSASASIMHILTVRPQLRAYGFFLRGSHLPPILFAGFCREGQPFSFPSSMYTLVPSRPHLRPFLRSIATPSSNLEGGLSPPLFVPTSPAPDGYLAEPSTA